jgi:hypothetical protein
MSTKHAESGTQVADRALMIAGEPACVEWGAAASARARTARMAALMATASGNGVRMFDPQWKRCPVYPTDAGAASRTSRTSDPPFSSCWTSEEPVPGCIEGGQSRLGGTGSWGISGARMGDAHSVYGLLCAGSSSMVAAEFQCEDSPASYFRFPSVERGATAGSPYGDLVARGGRSLHFDRDDKCEHPRQVGRPPVAPTGCSRRLVAVAVVVPGGRRGGFGRRGR